MLKSGRLNSAPAIVVVGVVVVVGAKVVVVGTGVVVGVVVVAAQRTQNNFKCMAPLTARVM